MANEKRLIDANVLVEFVGTRTSTWIYKPDLFWAIKQQPTVDAVPVVHGYWIDGCVTDHIGRVVEHCVYCSVCVSVFKDDSREVVKNWKERFKFCPFCGAKMDGDEK